MSITLRAAAWPIYLQELILPWTVQFQDPASQDLSSCTAVLKVRQTLASSTVIVTLTEIADIDLGPTGLVTVTFTSAHFAALLAGLSGDGVYDLIVIPPVGAPQMAAAGLMGVSRTVSR